MAQDVGLVRVLDLRSAQSPWNHTGSKHVGAAGRRGVLGMLGVHNYDIGGFRGDTSLFLADKTALSVGAIVRHAPLGPRDACQSKPCRTVGGAASCRTHGGRGRCCGQGGEEAMVWRWPLIARHVKRPP